MQSNELISSWNLSAVYSENQFEFTIRCVDFIYLNQVVDIDTPACIKLMHNLKKHWILHIWVIM